MRDRLTVSLKSYQGERWADLNSFGLTHEFCGEVVKMKDEKFSFLGGHRVRLYSFKKNVHWRIPSGIEVDISDVPALAAPAGRRGR
jgi:hypothetical protein